MKSKTSEISAENSKTPEAETKGEGNKAGVTGSSGGVGASKGSDAKSSGRGTAK